MLQKPYSKVVRDIGGRLSQEDTFCQNKIMAKEEHHMYGVFDGHNGADVSVYLSKQMGSTLAECMMRYEDPKDSMFYAFKELDQNIEHKFTNNIGSTGLVVTVSDSLIIAANCGDSMAIIGAKQYVKDLSMEHKVDKEADRLLQSGAQITRFDGIGRLFGTLNLSRSFGDFYLKRFVVANPYVAYVARHPSMLYILLASDGLWDVMNKDDVHSIILTQVYATSGKYAIMSFEQSVESAMNTLLLEARRRRSGDNLTMIFVDLSNRKL